MTDDGQLELIPAAAPRRRTKAAPPAPEAAGALPVARVVVDSPLAHLDRPFDYLVPTTLDADVVPGCRVRVRFSGRLTDAFVVDRVETSEHEGTLAFLSKVVSAGAGAVACRPRAVPVGRRPLGRHAQRRPEARGTAPARPRGGPAVQLIRRSVAARHRRRLDVVAARRVVRRRTGGSGAASCVLGRAARPRPGRGRRRGCPRGPARRPREHRVRARRARRRPMARRRSPRCWGRAGTSSSPGRRSRPSGIARSWLWRGARCRWCWAPAGQRSHRWPTWDWSRSSTTATTSSPSRARRTRTRARSCSPVRLARVPRC